MCRKSLLHAKYVGNFHDFLGECEIKVLSVKEMGACSEMAISCIVECRMTDMRGEQNK